MKIETKFKRKQTAYLVICDTILRGQIELFDLFTMKYLIYTNPYAKDCELGDMWVKEEELFATRAEAEQALKRLEGKDE